MKLELVHPKKLLGTSTNQGELFNKTYEVGDISFTLGELDFYTQAIDSDTSQLIINEITTLKRTSFGDYQSKEGLEIHAKKIGDKILVVSAGETNRGQYKIFIEGIWEIMKKENIF